MPIVLIPISFVLIFYIFNFLKKLDWRYAFVLSSLFTGGLIVAATEALSSFMLLSVAPMSAFWLISILLLVSYILIVSEPNLAFWQKAAQGAIRCALEYRILFLCLFAYLFITGLLAWIAPPNTYDSMTYHMSRVAHWIQNKTVDFYPTNIFRQLVAAPFSEYAIANLQILFGSDRFANFVQWSSMAGCLIVVSAISAQLGASRFGQIVSSIVCASIPMGILQSTSTQTDYLVGFWLTTLVYCILRWAKKQDLLCSIAIGTSFGLAILTKPTAYIYAFPFVIYLAACCLWKVAAKKVVLLIISLIVTVGLNSGHLVRNYESFGTPIAQSLDSGHYSYENEIISPKTTISNLLRNTGLHLENGTRFDRLFQRFIERTHETLKIDINDERTTWPGYLFKIQGNSRHEDYAGNYYHTILIVFCLIFYFVLMQKNNVITIYAACLIVSYIAFCTYLRWQPWHSRLQLPYFVLWSPFIGLIIDHLNKYRIRDVIELDMPLITNKVGYIKYIFLEAHKIKISHIAITILIVSSIPLLLSSATKPVMGVHNVFNTPRELQFFISNPNFKNSYVEISDLIKSLNCKKIGLQAFADDWEYPLWASLNQDTDDKSTIEYISTPFKITNNTLIEKSNSYIPCAIVTPGRYDSQSIVHMNINYSLIYSAKFLNLYVP